MAADAIDCGHQLRAVPVLGTAEPVTCTRPLGHLGQHQDWTSARRFTWGEDGSAASDSNPIDESTIYVCTKCGQQEHWEWSIDPVDPTYCFYCNFWLKLLRSHDTEDNWLVIDGEHYQVGPATGWQGGFGGQRFTIAANDLVITTTNLWTQGKIPEHWLKDFPNTAEFIQAALQPPAHRG